VSTLSALMLWLAGVGEGFILGCVLSSLAGYRRRHRPTGRNSP